MNNLAFYIQGNSMAPTISNGDMVICRELEPFESIEENELYAIITTSGIVMVKRIQKVRRNGNSQIIQLKLADDNQPEKSAFKIPTCNIRTLLKVEEKLTATA
ncbi:S24 family peptidase [Aureispira anguillae]|uniref:S24/S26 family peptidase n=1 Tax=Aureispira anguillae TaxID=2864201 RepID=A0A916DWK9_9BACT|nr:S24/S26 family peptidase [Aureispira anguillae]BDS14800.1 S24/S26 family peptidase [Aureispira anguillae]